MKSYGIKVNRDVDSDWLMISIPELDGLTQARDEGEVELMAREFIAVETGTPIGEVAVTIV